jgi:hypothetical protein
MDPRPGDLWVVRTNGFVAWSIRLLTRSTVNHAGIYLPNNQVGEADTSGFRIRPNTYGDRLITVPIDLDDYQRNAVWDAALSLVGTPYNFLDIAALAVALTTGRATPRFIAQRLSNPRRLMCSQACDELMLRVNYHLFDDGRLPGEVTPQDLLLLKEPTP